MLKIRLARGGAKKKPYYRIVVADVRSPRDGRFLEKVGTYNPMLPKDDENRVTLKEDRIKHWLGQGAQATDRVAIFLGKAGITEMPERKSNPNKAKPKAKAVERVKEKEEKAKAAAEAAAEAEAEANSPTEEAVAETPAEETATEEATEEKEA